MTGPLDGGLPPGVETETVAGVAVPATCVDRIDRAALRAVVDVLEEHGVDRYAVSPVGGVRVRIGARRPERVRESLRTALAAAGHGLSEHGVRDGYVRLRVGLDPDTG